MVTNNYAYETSDFIIYPFISGSKRHHKVKSKSGRFTTQTFNSYEEARDYIKEMEEAFKLNEPDA